MSSTLQSASVAKLASLAALGMTLALATGCATPGDVAGQSAIATARYAIRAAENQQADQYAAADLDRAREKLAAAQEAAQDLRTEEARRFAEQATVDAKLAGALAGKAQAEIALSEANRVRRENEALGSEARDAKRNQR